MIPVGLDCCAPRRKLAFALALLSLSLGCAKKTPTPHIPDVFSGYRLLANPRSEIPIGAVWYQGTGPNGSGAAEENIAAVDGVAVLNFMETQRHVLEVNIASFIGLTGGQAKHVSVDLSDLKIVRVKDFFQLDPRTGDNILYEGISAGTMTFSYDRSLGLDVGTKFAAKGIPVDATMTTGRIDSVTVHGKDLYLAYRVLQFVQLDRSDSNVLTDGTPDDMAVLARGLQITADASAMMDCAYAADVEDCVADAPIKMTILDPSLTSISGTTATKEITIRMRQDRMKPFTLFPRKEKELATGTVFVAQYIQFDIPPPQVFREPTGVAGDGNSPMGSAEIFFRPAANSGKLTEVWYEMRDLEPRAPGW